MIFLIMGFENYGAKVQRYFEPRNTLGYTASIEVQIEKIIIKHNPFLVLLFIPKI